jgi:putative methyltransferase (TIGR04325 family)
MRSLIKPLVPAPVRRFLRARLLAQQAASAPPAEPPEWEYCKQWPVSDNGMQGWNAPSVAATQRAKWDEFVALLHGPHPFGISHEAPANSGNQSMWAHNLIACYGYVLALAAHQRDRLSILDWGGGIGHYYEFSRALLPSVHYDYYCADVPSLCATGRSLLPDVKFLDRPEQSFQRSYDFVHAGSSLWCVQDWQGMAAKLAQAAQGYLYVTRMVFVQNVDSFIAIQRPYKYNGYDTQYPCWILNQRQFVDFFTLQGLDLVREFLLGDGPSIYGAPEHGFFKGFLFRKC